jgi:tetratricopeptide (TPR) repeat protein
MNGEWIRNARGDTSVVFVHGILAKENWSWRHVNRTYWPELLAQEQELEGLNVYVFSYRTGIFSGTYQLGDVVDALKERMRLDGLLDSKRLVFVCHSMGGIVVRRFIVVRQMDFKERQTQLGLFMVASPSLGSSYANLLTYLGRALGIRNAQAEALRFAQDNAWLNDLDKDFINLKETDALAIKGKELVEDNFIVIKRWWRRQVVEPFSGARYFGESYKVEGSDHSSIAAPENGKAIQHQLLCRFIREMLAEPISVIQKSKSRDAGHHPSMVFALPGTHRPNPHFTQRSEVHTALYALQPGDVLVLHGLGGVGKTQHAVQYAHEQRDRYRQILWASAESKQILRDALAALAELPELALPVETDAASVEKIHALRRWFGDTESWLLILDNADSHEAARAIEDLLPSKHGGHVIITARVAEWTSAFRLQRIEAWDDAQSVTFLSKRLAERSPAPGDLARLAQALGGLPLALEHAAAYICETQVSVGEYLRLLARDCKTLLARHYPGMTDYRASVATTWHVTIRRLSFLSRYLLHLAACLSPDPIPRHLFDYILASASADYTHEFIELGFLRRALAAPNAIDVSLAELARYSLVTLSEQSLRVHPLLQAVVRDSARLRPWNYYYRIWRLAHGISGKEAWKVALWPKRAACLLDTDGVLPDLRSDVEAPPQIRPYAPHIEAVLSHLPEKLFEGFSFRTALVGTLQRYREYSEAVSALRNILAPAAERSTRLKEETEWFFANLDNLYERAAARCRFSHESWMSNTLKLKLSSLRHGGDSERQFSNVYDFLRSLSHWLAEAGDTTAARRLYQFCSDHAMESDASPVERAYTLIDEAHVLIAVTPVEETQRLLEEGIMLFEQHKGMAPYGNVIIAVSVYAKFAETPVQRMRAVGWLRQLLPPAQQLLRHGAPHACYAAAQLVRLLKESGQMDEALAVCEETLQIAVRSRKLWRPRAEHLAPLWEQRGSVLKEFGRSLAAARSYTRCLALERQHNKPTPLRVAGLLTDAGEMFRCAGCLGAAESRLLEAVTLLDKGWTDNPDYAEILASLIGIALGRVERQSEGEALLRRSIASRCERLGPEHAKLASPHRLLGIFLHEAERLSEAETEFRRALVLSEKDAQPDNSTLLPALDSLAHLLEDLQRHAEALPLRQRYLALAEKQKDQEVFESN